MNTIISKLKRHSGTMHKGLRRLIMVCSLLISVVSQVGPAHAISNYDLQSVIDDTTLYDAREYANAPTACGDPDTAGTGAQAAGSNNVEKTFNFLVGQGLKNYQAAGIIGNLEQESGQGLHPDAQEDGSNSPTPKNGVGFGIAQWTYTGRQKPLVDLAKKEGVAVNTLGVQLDYLWEELTTTQKFSLEAVKAATTYQAATIAFERVYEVCGDCQEGHRLANALAVTKESYYGGSIGDAIPGIICAAQSTIGLNGFIRYDQCQPGSPPDGWANHAYTYSTICAGGCGPSALAMIITNLTGKKVTPIDTADYAGAHGLHISSGGSSWAIAPVLAAHWNLKSAHLSPTVSAITGALKSGALVAAPGRGSIPYTSSGHYLVIRGIAPDGNWYIGDSYQLKHPSSRGNDSTKEWSPSKLVGEMVADGGGGGVYAISK